MEAQNVLFRGSFHSAKPLRPMQANRNYLYSTWISPPSLKATSSNWDSLKSRCPTSHILLNKRSLRCRNSVEKVEYTSTSDVREDRAVERKVGRKSLAIFVSGGGSNFRSIYEATFDGVVYGNISVLVTSKQGEHLRCASPDSQDG